MLRRHLGGRERPGLVREVVVERRTVRVERLVEGVQIEVVEVGLHVCNGEGGVRRALSWTERCAEQSGEMWEESSGESKRRAGPVPWVKAHDAKSGDGHGTSHARQMQERRQPMAPCTTLIALPSRRAQQRDSQYIEPLPGKSRVPGAGELSSRRGLEVVWAIIWLRLKRGAAPPPPPPHAEHGPSFPLPPSPGLQTDR